MRGEGRRRVFAEGERALRGYGGGIMETWLTRVGALRAFERRSAAPLEDAPTVRRLISFFALLRVLRASARETDNVNKPTSAGTR